MKNLKRFAALAMIAVLSLNAVNAHAYQLPEPSSPVDAGGHVSIQFANHSSIATPKMTVYIGTTKPVIVGGMVMSYNPQSTGQFQFVTLPSIAANSATWLATALPELHNCTVYVVTDVNKTNVQTSFWIQ